MSSQALRVRDAIRTRLESLPAFKDAKFTGTPQLQPDNLPAAAIFISREVMEPEGAGNTGALAFISDVTITIYVVRGFKTPRDLDADMDADATAIEEILLTDESFTLLGDGGFFESIERIERRRNFPQDGETYFNELRLEITFRTRVGFEVAVLDDYEGFTTTTRPAGSPNAPAITSHFDQQD